MKSKNFFPVIFFVLLVGFAWRLAALREVVPYHEDEHVYMNRAVFLDLYLRGDFFNPLWQEFEADYSKLPDVLYGAALILANQTSVQSSLAQTEFNKDAGERTSWNVIYSQQYIPMAELPPAIYERIAVVRVARWVSLGLTVGTLGIVMLLGRELGDWLMGCIAAAALVFHPLFTHVMLTAMGDAPLIFFSLLTLLFSLFWLRAFRAKQYHFGWAAVLGIALGLTISSKLNGLFSALFVIGFMLFTTLHSQKIKKVRDATGALLITGAVCANTFLLLTPQIWSSPFSGFINMIQQREEIAQSQQKWFPSDALPAFSDRLAIAPQWLFSWHDGYGDFPVRWEQVGLFLLGVVAVYTWLKRAWGNGQSLYAQTLIAFILWASCIGGLTLASIPLNWNRYYLPIVLVVIMTQATGASFLIKLTFDLFQQSRQKNEYHANII